MSAPIENKPTKFKENPCPLSVAAYSKAIIEPQIGQEGIGMLSLAAITLVGERFDGTNAEEMYTSFKEILNGKCQKQNSSEFLAYWRSLQSKLEKLSRSQLKKLMFTFFGRLVNEGYNGPISIFKITDIFFDTCNLFVTPTETDDGDRFDEEHNTMVTLVHKDSLKGNHAVAGTEEAVDTHNINLRSPRNSNEEEIIMKNSDEVSCSQQELCETLTQRSDKSGKVKTQSELDTIHAIQVSAPSEAKISSMGETQAHGASGENNWGRLHKKGSAPSDAEIFPMGENQAHGASGENNKTSQDESTEPSMSKVSASPKEEKCLTGETEINGENRGKGTKKPRNVIRQNKVSEPVKESVRVKETESHGILETKKNENDNQHNKVVPPSSSEAPSQILVPSSGKADNIFKKPNELQVTSQQATCSEQPFTFSKPVQDERRKLKIAKNRLKAELFKSRRKHDQEMDVITKRKNRLQNKIRKLMEEMRKLVEKVDYLENMNEKLFTQTQNQLEDLLEYQAMDVRRPNLIFEKLVNLQWSNLPDREKEIIDFYQELVAILHKKIDFLTRRQDVPGTQEL